MVLGNIWFPESIPKCKFCGKLLIERRPNHSPKDFCNNTCQKRFKIFGNSLGCEFWGQRGKCNE